MTEVIIDFFDLENLGNLFYKNFDFAISDLHFEDLFPDEENAKRRAPFGLDDLEGKIEDYSIYPNPATEEIKILSRTTNQTGTIQIADLHGQVVRESPFEGHQSIFVGDLPTGTYLVSILSSLGRSIKKLVKM